VLSFEFMARLNSVLATATRDFLCSAGAAFGPKGV
jgi:hypothetical protein